MKKILVIVMVLACAGSAWCADIVSIELEGMILRSEFNRLGNGADPFEREALLRKIIEQCEGTEDGEIAYWDLANVYLDEFPEEMREEARNMLEECLKSYPNTRRAVLVKCRLIDLYEAKDSRRAELVRQLKKEPGLPTMLKASIN